MLGLETNNYIFACLGFQNCHKEKVFEKWSISWHKFVAFLPQRWNVVLRTLFAHSSSTRDKIVFENDAWYMAKNNLFWVIAANRPITFFFDLFVFSTQNPQKNAQSNPDPKKKQNSSPYFLCFFSFSSSLLVKKTNKQKPRKGRHICSDRMSSFSNANLLISGNNASTFLASSSFFSSSSSVSACDCNKWGVKNKWNWDKPEATSTKWRFKTKKTVQRGDDNSLYELQMSLLESEVWGHREEQKWHGQEQSQTIENVLKNHKRRYVQHLNWSVLCFVGDDIWELRTQIATVFSCEIKESFVWQSLFVRCNKLRILTWIASWEQFSSSHHNHESTTLQMWDYFCSQKSEDISVSKQKEMLVSPNNSRKNLHSFLWWLDDICVSFILFCWWKAVLEQKYAYKWFNFSFFCWQNTKRANIFLFVFWLHLQSCISTPFILCFEKTIPLSSCFLFWSFQKKERKTHSKRGWNYCSFKSFFFSTGNKSKKTKLASTEAQAWGKTPIFWAPNEFVRTKKQRKRLRFQLESAKSGVQKKNKQQKMFAKLLRFWKKNKMSEETHLHLFIYDPFPLSAFLESSALFCGSWVILNDHKCPFSIFSVCLFLDSVINAPHLSSSWASDWVISMVSGLLISTLLLLISIFLLATRNCFLLQHHEHCFPNLFFHSVVRDSKFLSPKN